jgi:hypothetical protein
VCVLISKLLLSNRHLRQKKPILFICQTNHALDQMLEHVAQFEPNIVRVGGRSESTLMQSKNIAVRRQSMNFNIKYPARFEAMDKMTANLAGIKAAAAQFRAFSTLLSASQGEGEGGRGGGAQGAQGEGGSMGMGICAFPNCLLGRLRTLLEHVTPGAGRAVDELAQPQLGCPIGVQRTAWKMCVDA